MVDVSVCISVHNTATLLPRCLDSVCAQTLSNIEIVLVNNGSTDKSEEVMHYYSDLHPERNFVIVSQEDRGLAQGRQTGINHANGEYIAFLDADDYVDKFAYEKLHKAAVENHVDIVECETRREGRIISSPLTGIHNTKDIFKMCLAGEFKTPSMLWLRLYHRSLFDKPVLPNLYTNNEDNFAYLCLLYRSNTIFYLKEVLHEYTTDNENAYMSIISDKKNTEKRYKARKTILKCVKHIQDYVGLDVIKKHYYKEFNSYKARVALVFVYEDFNGVRYQEKVKEASKAIGLSEKELPKFIRNNIGTNSPTLKLVHLFGFKSVYIVLKFLNHKLQ